MFNSVISSPLGKIGIATQDNHLIRLQLLAENAKLQPPSDSFSKKVAAELKAYFSNPNKRFSIPLLLSGTSFQKKVWAALQNIPLGKTLSYGTLAKQLKTSPRAIGQACRTNRIAIIIPCHRIVAAQDLGGFGGQRQGKWLELKKWLLRHEQGQISS